MHGFYNKLLRIDLTSRTFTSEEIADEVFETHLGGKGLGSYLMLKEIAAGIDPLSADNKLIFTVGAVTGAKLWGSARYGVFAKSPLTGIFGESYCGGKVAPAIKATGYDAVVLQGKSDNPVYLEITENRVEFHDASDLWGKDTYETEDTLLERVAVPTARAVVIGPAGENLVKFALLENDHWRSAGRVGMGAVMGSKLLKGVVFHGSAVCQLADPALIKDVIKRISARTKDELKDKVKNWRERGTTATVNSVIEHECFPTRYWYEGTHENWENLSSTYMLNNFDVKPNACPSCFLACGNITTAKCGPYKGLTIEGPEYETIYALGGLNCLNTMEEVNYLNDLCDRLGIDTMTAGNVTAFAIEAVKRGKLDFDIDYGQTERIAELMRLIVRREGVGDILADGVRLAAEKLGLENIAIHVKGLEPGGYDPRVLKGIGLQYAVASRGACHMRGTVHSAELSGLIAPDAVEGKTNVFVENENKDALFDSLIFCRFFRSIYTPDDLSDVLKGTMGLDWRQADFDRATMHITTQARRFNVREGISRKDDTLPNRFFDEPLEPNGKKIVREEFDGMVGEYYAIHGWDENGIPVAS